jgi:hypothetical protein
MERLLDTHEQSEGIDLMPSFARHETFHPRYGWLKKGFDAASSDPSVFLRRDAMTRLGVGKNMVRAIRYWCSAYKVLEQRPNPEQPRLRDSYPTTLGKRLLADDGWDPYLEDPTSLWLLHWQLLRSPCAAPAWFAIFNTFRATDFTDDALVNLLRLFCDGHPEWGDVADNSLLKDARCLLRMYASATTGRDLAEDTIDSPFVELDLIRHLQGSKRHFIINMGAKRSLSPLVVAFASLDFAVQRRMTARVMTLSRLTHAPGSPGRAFQLTESVLGALLERFAQTRSGLRLTQAAGASQLVIDEALYESPIGLLEEHYRATDNGHAANARHRSAA